MSRNTRTVLGFSLIIAGIAGGLWLAWWLSFRGDIIEIIHQLKMSLPGWGWRILKFGLSVAVGIIYLFICIALGMKVLGGNRSEGKAEQGGDPSS